MREQLTRKDDGIGPGTYTVKIPNIAPKPTFGTRFNSSIRNKDHIRPTKVDGPGPGSHKMPSSIIVKRRHPNSVDRTTFGTSAREFVDLP